jgi:hypothetical protein
LRPQSRSTRQYASERVCAANGQWCCGSDLRLARERGVACLSYTQLWFTWETIGPDLPERGRAQ